MPPFSDLIPGHATHEGTHRYADRFKQFPEGAFRSVLDLKASSIGHGTYLGEPEDGAAYRAAIRRSFESGCNVLDTAINYRHQASERDAGMAIRQALEAKTISRDEIIVSTKGGFLPLDHEVGMDNPKKYLKDTYTRSGILSEDDIHAGCQSFAPRYIDDQFERSRKNLGLETIDIYFLHNPEMHLREYSRGDFLQIIEKAFRVLVEKVRNKRLQFYGVATWEGLRKPGGDETALSLHELRKIAIDIEGPTHHLRVIQLPFNLAMSEALRVEHDYHFPGKSVLEVADEMLLFTMTSASLMQGQLSKGLPEQLSTLFPGLANDAQRALQHTRCAPGVTTALVGMKKIEHVRANTELLAKEVIPTTTIQKMYAALKKSE